MEPVHLFEKPSLRNPVLIAAFAGWNDAAQAATSALRFLQKQWKAQLFAEIEPDDFVVFTETRPGIRLKDGVVREIDWPATQFFFHSDATGVRDFILVVGVEPQLRWRAYATAILRLSREMGVRTVLTLGALLADVPHTSPTRMIGYSNDPSLASRLVRLKVETSEYEGPTGITGVLSGIAAEQGFRSASLWGSVPAYLSSTTNPKVALCILQRLQGIFDLRLSFRELEESGQQFDQQVVEAIANNPQISEYVKQLEQREAAQGEEGQGDVHPLSPPDLPPGQSVVDEIEEFLRRQRKDEHGDE